MATNSSTGMAGRTVYRQWDRVATDLIQDAQAEEEKEAQESAKALGLDGKYARSEAEAEERKKAKDARKTKKQLDRYQKRENQAKQQLSGLFEAKEESKATEAQVVRITRDMIDAGKRVVTLSDTKGSSLHDMIVFSLDLNHLESVMPNSKLQPKHYEGDAENEVPQQTSKRSVYGLIKLFISNVHNCTIVLRCKLISGTVELSHCSNIALHIEKEATVATLQVDLCQDVFVEFRDAPSGKNSALPGQPTLYWGDDKDDRIFSAGVQNCNYSLLRDGFVETETVVDYIKDGAVAVGNATAEECQFVTSVVDGELTTEKVLRTGSTTGKSARAMTQRELDAEKEKREQAAAMAVEKAEQAIKFVEKTKTPKARQEEALNFKEKEDVVEEIYTSMSKEEINSIVAECEDNKARGNEAFGSGEYAQAVLLYTLVLDKADELPDKAGDGPQLFPRHIVLSNRSASFLKLGEHEKALADATRAQEIDPAYVKAVFRKGLALHAMGRYKEALPVLVEAQKLEPKNKQIKQALQFCEIRLTQEIRKRMG